MLAAKAPLNHGVVPVVRTGRLLGEGFCIFEVRKGEGREDRVEGSTTSGNSSGRVAHGAMAEKNGRHRVFYRSLVVVSNLCIICTWVRFMSSSHVWGTRPRFLMLGEQLEELLAPKPHSFAFFPHFNLSMPSHTLRQPRERPVGPGRLHADGDIRRGRRAAGDQVHEHPPHRLVSRRLDREGAGTKDGKGSRGC